MNWLIIFTLTIHISIAVQDVDSDNLYTILGVNNQADTRDIRKAYKKLALLLHPDKNKSNKTTHEKFLRITKAYETLKDAELRRQYDLYGDKFLKRSTKDTWKQEYYDYRYFTSRFGYFDDDSRIIELTDSDFDNINENEGTWFVFFYNPHCDKCYAVKDDWIKIANDLEGVVFIGTVNCREQYNRCNQLGFNHLPKFVVFHKNGTDVFKTSHEKTTSFEELLEFALSFVKINVIEITSTMWNKGTQTQWVLSLCQNEDEKDLLKKLATILENIVSVGKVTDRELCESIYPDYKNTPLLFWRRKSVGTIASFAIQPLIGRNSRQLADQVLTALPDPEEIDEHKFYDIKTRLELGSDESWLFCFYVGSITDIFIQIKRLPALLPNLKIGTIACARNHILCNELNIGHYPSWGVLKSTGLFELYYGRDSINDIAAFARDSIKATNLEYISDSVFYNMRHKGDSWIIIWSVSWCPPCRNLLPKVRKTCHKYLSEIKFGIIDCQQYKTVCLQNGIQHYPTVQFYKNNKKYDFFGPYTTRGLADYIDEMLDSNILYLDDKLFDTEIINKKAKDVWIVLYYSPTCPACHNVHSLWRKLSFDFALHKDIKFAEIDCKQFRDVCQKVRINFYPTIHIYPTGSVGINTYDTFKGVSHYTNILEWIQKFIFTSVQHVSNHFEKITGPFTTSLILFHKNRSNKFKELGNEFYSISQDEALPSDVNFYIMNCEFNIDYCKLENITEDVNIVLYNRGVKQYVNSKKASEITDEVKSLLYSQNHDEL